MQSDDEPVQFCLYLRLDALQQLNNTSQDIYSVALQFVAGLTNGFNQLSLSKIFKFLRASQGSASMNSCNSVALKRHKTLICVQKYLMVET